MEGTEDGGPRLRKAQRTGSQGCGKYRRWLAEAVESTEYGRPRLPESTEDGWPRLRNVQRTGGIGCRKEKTDSRSCKKYRGQAAEAAESTEDRRPRTRKVQRTGGPDCGMYRGREA